MPSTPKPSRAEPLAAEDRRQAIVDAVIPLLVRRGAPLSTRQMAEAAGVAEGTIYGVFPDKSAVIHYAIEHSMDPGPLVAALRVIDPAVPMRDQIAAAAHILSENFEKVIVLFGVLRAMNPDHVHRPRTQPRFVAEATAAVMEGLTEVFARHRRQLRIDPDRAAAAFHGLVFSNAHPLVAQKLTVGEIVDVLLSGVALSLEESVL